jgi:hypothetical protein
MRLTIRARKALPSSEFAGPDRSYPVDTRGRAANAKARATQAVKAGRMSTGTEEKIDARANKVLGTGKKRVRKARNEDWHN